MLNAKTIENVLKVRFNTPILPSKYRAISFGGACDGTTLSRLYNDKDLQGRYVRLLSLHLAFYADNSIWLREGAWDDQAFTGNSASRYSTVRPYSRLDYFWLEKRVSTNKLSILIDSHPLNLFPQTYFPLFDEYFLNVLSQKTIVNGIDLNLNMTFYKDPEADTTQNPYVTALMIVEILDGVDPLIVGQQK